MKKIIIAACLLITTTLNAQNFEWANTLGGNSNDGGRAIRVDASSNVYISGYFEGTVDFDPGAGTTNLTSVGGTDIFILKMDAFGNFLWAKAFGGTSDDFSLSMTLDSIGNVYTTGYFQGTVDFDPGTGTANLNSVGNFDAFVHKLDASGNFQWAKVFGDTTFDAGASITLDASGYLYTTGGFEGTVDFDPGVGTTNLSSVGTRDIFVQKMDTSGNFIWAKTFGGSSFDGGISISIDASGNVYTTGYFYGTADFDPGAGTSNLSSAGNEDIFVQKMDSFGNFLWAKAFGSSASIETGNSVIVDALGNVYTSGTFQGTVDFDPGAGATNLSSAGGIDVFVQKMDASGNFLWAKAFGGPSSDYSASISLDASGNVYSTGNFQGIVDFDPGAGTSNLLGAASDVFVQKMDASGNFLWAKAFGGTLWDAGNSVIVDAVGNVYTTGRFQGNVDFDPGVNTAILSAAGGDDVFVHKMSQCMPTVGIDIQTACDSYTWIDGNTYTASTSTATDTLTNAAGCDSVVTLNLTITNSNTGSDTVTACDIYTWPANGQTYTMSGTQTATLMNAAGCDSVVTLSLTINNSNTGTDVVNACDSYTWIDGNTYTSNNNSATFTLNNQNGCDSVVTLDLIINSSSASNIAADICDGDIFVFGSQTLASSGTYVEVFTDINGCDSTVTLTLNVTTLDTTVNLFNNTLTANASGAIYQWLDCDNGYLKITGETNQSFIPTINGNYAVEITANGCLDTSNCISITTLGIIENSFSENLVVSPNPNNGNFYIDLGAVYESSHIVISDISGRVISTTSKKQTQVLNLTFEEPAGVYLVTVQAGGRKAVIQLVKE